MTSSDQSVQPLGGQDKNQQQEPGFIPRDQESDSSIGSGTSDQGIEPGMENQEDEFRKDYSVAADPSMFNDVAEGGSIKDDKTQHEANKPDEPAGNDFPEEGGQGSLDKGYGFINQKPSHGLVEEGPGPDS